MDKDYAAEDFKVAPGDWKVEIDPVDSTQCKIVSTLEDGTRIDIASVTTCRWNELELMCKTKQMYNTLYLMCEKMRLSNDLRDVILPYDWYKEALRTVKHTKKHTKTQPMINPIQLDMISKGLKTSIRIPVEANGLLCDCPLGNVDETIHYIPPSGENIKILIVDIRTEKLLQITDKEAMEEGFTESMENITYDDGSPSREYDMLSPRDMFLKNWCEQYPKYYHKTNPYVWVVKVQVIH